MIYVRKKGLDLQTNILTEHAFEVVSRHIHQIKKWVEIGLNRMHDEE